ncbi:hypothetical protein ITJ66_16620 [Plantibacter sp. VKM Ac-2885]|uniref:hypothetical protein n=1 Tax=Plantibacter sp. VKM Ac-2885 TaxID=2783828 RepID=UPI00188C12DF|nr:hypothetical protein [Plantibacter sp. VKM Ac-2885]MBF4514111.1 hypothetical protein [Plantibacter sp. VKM Ac-2885]
MFLPVFTEYRSPESRTYDDRKTAKDQRHNRAIVALARRRFDVLYAALRIGILFQPTSHAGAA